MSSILSYKILPFENANPDQLLDLHDLSFGPGRFARTAFRIRETSKRADELSVVALENGELLGAVELWHIQVGARRGLLLGPLAVMPAAKNKGVGKALMTAALLGVTESKYKFVLLVGDLPYYSSFGFSRVEEGHIKLPGPVDSNRLLLWQAEDDKNSLYGDVRGVRDE